MKRMRILRQLCVDSDGSCRDQFFKVMGQVDDWEWEDLNPAKLHEDQHVSNLTQSVFENFFAWPGCRLPEPTAWHSCCGIRCCCTNWNSVFCDGVAYDSR